MAWGMQWQCYFRCIGESLFSCPNAANSSASVISKIFHKWSVGNFPSHTNHLVILRTDILFSTAFLLYCVRAKHPKSYISGQLFTNTDCSGGVEGGQTFLMCVSKLSDIKGPKHLSHFFPNLAKLSESFHLSWHPEDSLKEPYVSSASSQQQSQDHHALLSYHANKAGTQTGRECLNCACAWVTSW